MGIHHPAWLLLALFLGVLPSAYCELTPPYPNRIGSTGDACDEQSGQCVCWPKFAGKYCDQCKDGYYDYPVCAHCQCDIHGTDPEICNKVSGECLCKNGYGGARCDHCMPGFYNFPECIPCNCSTAGSIQTICDNTGKCPCLQNFAGKRCDQCMTGSSPNGPIGGYSIPCECNGHADTCDCNTGICQDCQHHTTGDHCDMCVEGYHGNATLGTPYDCMICACPLPIDSNNFATGCDVSLDGYSISCDCKPGYTGHKCQSCSNGFFGRPEVEGEFCKLCECSGNIDPSIPGSCDSVTGDCIHCLSNTFGEACNICAPGFYGDAIRLKDCQACICDTFGTDHCDNFIGTCVCLPNVEGDKCDRCHDDHYGFESGYGCMPCDCGVASYGTQCDDHTGVCDCKPGVGGRQCDRCLPGFWNYGPDGCETCSCNYELSNGLGCNPVTGQCECLHQVIGKKCESCPHRWVFIENYGCEECDDCQDGLLDVTDATQKSSAN